jgi:uncharacterized protein with HEPN domain
MSKTESGILSEITSRTKSIASSFAGLMLLDQLETRFVISEKLGEAITRNLENINELRDGVREYLRTKVSDGQWGQLAGTLNTLAPQVRYYVGGMVEAVGGKLSSLMVNRGISGEAAERVIGYLSTYTQALSLDGKLSVESIVAAFMLLYAVETMSKKRPMLSYFLKPLIIITSFVVYAIPEGGISDDNIFELTTNIVSAMFLFLAATNLLNVVNLTQSIVVSIISGVISVCTGIVNFVGTLGSSLVEFFAPIGHNPQLYGDADGGSRSARTRKSRKTKKRSFGRRRTRGLGQIRSGKRFGSLLRS